MPMAVKYTSRRAEREQLVHGEGKRLRRLIVDVAAQLHDLLIAVPALTQEHTHDVRRCKILLARAVAGGGDAHLRHRTVVRHELPQQRRTCGRAQLTGHAAGIDRVRRAAAAPSPGRAQAARRARSEPDRCRH